MLKAGYLLFVFICMHLCFFADAQPGTTIDLKKPDKYENRTLASEKTTESKIKGPEPILRRRMWSRELLWPCLT